MNTNIKIGDKIGMIIKYLNPRKYELIEDNVKSIVVTKNGVKVCSKKSFFPLELHEIELNTSMMKKDKKLILKGEPVLIDDELRKRMNDWCMFATEHYDELEK